MPWKIVSTDLYFFARRMHYALLRITGSIPEYITTLSVMKEKGHKKIPSGTGEDFTIIYRAGINHRFPNGKQ